MRRIIGITGMPGSGKGEVSRIASGMDIPVRSLGDIVRKHFAENCSGRPPSEIGLHADEQRRQFGKDIWARRLVEDVEDLLKNGKRIVMIDGVRSSHEVDVFKERWGEDFMILCIHSSPETRFQRLSNRGRNDDPGDRRMFDERDLRELGWGLGNVIALADRVMVNESNMGSLELEIRSFIEEDHE